jgi:hypothetical protein
MNIESGNDAKIAKLSNAKVIGLFSFRVSEVVVVKFQIG